MSTHTMPSLFVGHGSPMNLILDNTFTQALKELPTALPKPKAILVISAHWYTDATLVSFAQNTNATLYDFYGFPKTLYNLQYKAPSDKALSQKVARLLDVPLVERGLDHGAWMPLHFLYPKADIPTFQLSINKDLPLSLHVKIGEKLQTLRDEGVLIIGSGNITHNLGSVDFHNIDAPPPQWAQNVDKFIAKAFEERDIVSLVEIQKHCLEFPIAHPSIDHYLPLLYIAGTLKKEDKISSILKNFQNSSLSMRGFLIS